jgi:hypothetical protein
MSDLIKEFLHQEQKILILLLGLVSSDSQCKEYGLVQISQMSTQHADQIQDRSWQQLMISVWSNCSSTRAYRRELALKNLVVTQVM